MYFFFKLCTFFLVPIVISNCNGCAANCEELQSVTATLDIQPPLIFQGRNCMIPFQPTGDICDFPGMPDPFIFGQPLAMASSNYMLMAQYVFACDNWLQFPEISECLNNGTCRETFTTNGDKALRFMLNTDGGNCTPTIPIPVNNLANFVITVFYREPCIDVSDNCFDFQGGQQGRYRTWYEGSGIANATFSDPDVTTSPILLNFEQHSFFPGECR